MDKPRGTPEWKESTGRIYTYKNGVSYFRPYSEDPKSKEGADALRGDKTEYYKMLIAGCIATSVIIIIGMVIMNFRLLLNDMQSMSQEVITAITVLGGILAGIPTFAYAAMNSIRAWSYNKHVDGPCKTNGGGF
jgi:hypothetical protein